MQYVLVQDKQAILLGPIFWRHRFIQSELEDLEVDFIVSPAEPNEYVQINDSLEIYPVTELAMPSYDSTFEQLDGPYWSFANNVAVGTYNIAPRDLNSIKNDLKSLTASERYKKEISGIKMTIQNTEVSVATDRESRNVYTQKLVAMADDDTAQWKFPEAWLTLTKSELSTLLNTVTTHVQTQYDWESGIISQIDSASDVDALKNIAIVEKTETFGVM